VSDASHVHVSAYRLPDSMAEAGAGALKPFHTFTHHMSRARESWQQTVADTVFPFRLSFTSENSAYAAPELTFSPRMWSHALPMSLVLAFRTRYCSCEENAALWYDALMKPSLSV
ncbi:MAG: hypothetical protein IJZ18_00795, partial [Mailhella sp.]|nr:hypothetical protein [Mailhella sp.]